MTWKTWKSQEILKLCEKSGYYTMSDISHDQIILTNSNYRFFKIDVEIAQFYQQCVFWCIQCDGWAEGV